MKRMFLVLCAAALLFAGCASDYMADGAYEYTRVKTEDSAATLVHAADRGGGAAYDLLFSGGDTITCGGETYRYTYSGQDKNNYSLNIVYPNGESMHWSFSGGMGSGGGSLSFGHSYLDDDLLLGAIRFAEGAGAGNISLGGIALSLVVLFLGLLALFAPEATWWLHSGWRYKNAEPSDFALGAERVGGAVAIAVGIFLLFGGMIS